MRDCKKLLDNRWDIQIFRQTDGRYVAAAKKTLKETWNDVFAFRDEEGKKIELSVIAKRFLEGGLPESWGPMRNRIAVADEPDEAIRLLTEKVLCGRGES